MNDLISRQAVIDVLDVLCQEHMYGIPGKAETYSSYNEAWQDALDRAEGAIFNLPSAKTERKTGRWEMKPDPYGFDEIPVCSECGCTTKMKEIYNYCPNCGAKMDKEK